MPETSQPSALRKAEALANHIRGSRTADAAVILTDREAWEFLDWYMTSLPRETVEYFRKDLAAAKAMRDPWPMLQGFQIKGFDVLRASVEMH